MSRSRLHVRDATDADLPAIFALGTELRELPGDLSRSRDARRLEDRYRDLLDDPGRRLVLVVSEADELLGMALLTLVKGSPLLDVPAAQLTHMVVAGRHRHRGVGRTLVATAAAFAEEAGVEQVLVGVHPGDREANRFFARLGFAPLAVRRGAPLAVLRRRLADLDAPSPERLRRGARRRGVSRVRIGRAAPMRAVEPDG